MKTDPICAPVAAEVRQDKESEAYIVREIKKSNSANSWRIGELAAQWTQSWARGRGDEDLGGMVGMTGDQIYQRRRVWERFGTSDTYRNFNHLSWSHFYAALNWDDATEMLSWAGERDASVAEMKAHHAALHPPADLFPIDDPLGERGDTEEGGQEAEVEIGGAEETDDDTEEDGKDAEESGTRPPRNGTDKPGEARPPKTQKELFAEQKAKAIKTFEAGMRAIDDLHELRKIPRHDDMIDALGKLIKTVKSIK